MQDVDLSLDVQEFPNINPFYHGRRHRYVFSLSYPYLESSRLYKYDLEENTHRVWGGGNTADGGCYIPSEPVFSPRPGATDEDDGVVLSMVSVNGSDAGLWELVGWHFGWIRRCGAVEVVAECRD